MTNFYNSKNILYNSTLIADGNIHIGDKIYHIHQDFEQAILFLTIEKVILKKEKKAPKGIETHQYQATLAIKSKHVEGETLLKEPVQIPLTDLLLESIQLFSAGKRSQTGSNNRFFTQLSPNELWLEEGRIAKALFENIITGDIKQVCEDFIGLLDKRKIKGLVLAIHSSESEILNLPFELLQNEFGQYWSLQNDSFCIAHTTEKEIGQFNMQGKIAVAAPLRILFITALPEDLPENGKFLELEKEQRNVIEAIAVLESQRKVVVEFLDIAALENIDEALTKGKHHIVHISGHGAHLEQQKSGVLYLEDLDGNTQEVSGEVLGRVLNKHKSSLKLVMLSACETARAEEEGIIGGLIKTSGIPAIIGMRYPISDAKAILFTTQFYEHLCDNKSLTTALFHARESVYQQEVNQRKKQPNTIRSSEWFTPFLYLNQYVGSFIDTTKVIEIPAHFYNRSSLLKSKYSRTISDGFIGRRSYIAQLNQHFAKGKPVCIYGLGGIGKTTLGERFAENYQNKQYQLIQFSRGILTEQQIIETIAQEAYLYLKKEESLVERLKFQISSDKQPLEKLQLLISNYLARPDVKTILFFDNFEDNLFGGVKENLTKSRESGQVLKFHRIKNQSLRECLQYILEIIPNNCLFLMTCRYTIEDLQLTFVQLGKMSFPEVYRLFNTTEKLRGVGYIERQVIFKYLGGHPRAFELLLKYLENSQIGWNELEPTLPKVADELVYHDLFLEQLWKLLTDSEKQIIINASTFLKKTKLSPLIFLSNTDRKLLERDLKKLNEKGLLYFDGSFFELHNLTIRWITNTKMNVRQRESNNLKIARYYNNLNKNDGKKDILDGIESFHYYIKSSNVDETIDIAISISEFYENLGHYKSAIYFLNVCFLEEFPNDKMEVLYRKLAILNKEIGNYKVAINLHRLAIEVNEDIGDSTEEGLNTFQIGLIFNIIGKYNLALEHFDIAEQKFKFENDKNDLCLVYYEKGLIYQIKEEYIAALTYFDKALILARENNFVVGIANTLGAKGLLLIEQGKENGINLFLESIQIRKENGINKYIGEESFNMAVIYFDKNDVKSSQFFLKIAYDFAIENNNTSILTHSLLLKSRILFRQKKLEFALRCACSSFLIFESLHSPKIALASREISNLKSVMKKEHYDKILNFFDKKSKEATRLKLMASEFISFLKLEII